MKARLHWNVQKRQWTVHTYKGCEWSTYIRVTGDWTTELKPTNRSNPRGFVVCDRSQVEILQTLVLFPGPGYIQLRYDKEAVRFNVESGTGLIFTPRGAFAPADTVRPVVTTRPVPHESSAPQ